MNNNKIFLILIIIAIQANASEKLRGLNKCLPKNIKLENKEYNKGNWEVMKFIDTSKVINNKELSISLCFISVVNSNNIFSKDTSRYTEFDKYDSILIFKVKDNYYNTKNIDYLLFTYSIRKILNCYYKIDKPIGPGYGNNE